MTLHILLIDDDPKFRRITADSLRASHMECTESPDADAALAMLTGADAVTVDLVLLDIMMPGLSGWGFLQTVRGAGLTTPVIFVTAREAVDERVQGLRLGADDYIIKPFAFSELLARIEAVLRRRSSPDHLRINGYQLDLAKRRVRKGESWQELTPKECDLLRVLVLARGRPLSRPELLRQVWQIEHDPESNVVDVHVARLRRKLGCPGDELIRTVRGEGYALRATEDWH